MKLRIRDNSLRLRLTVGEVAQVAAGESVSAQMALPGGERLVYNLERGEPVDASLHDGVLRVVFPSATLTAWAVGDDVSLCRRCAISDGELELMVEKDFACLSPREGGDDADTFEHPEAGTARC